MAACIWSANCALVSRGSTPAFISCSRWKAYSRASGGIPSQSACFSGFHDFGGFDPRLYEIRYPATGCPEAAQQVVAALQAHGFAVEQDPQRGLDHGAWIPLRQMFPDADIPVVPVSVQTHAGPEHAYRIGQALAALAQQNFLIVASGNVTHNLRAYLAVRMAGGQTPEYVQGFADWVHQHMVAHDVQLLLNYRQASPGGARAHPSEDHLLPLFTALGAAGPDARPAAFFRGISDYVIAMDGYVFHEGESP